MELKVEKVGAVTVVDPGVKRIDATVAVALRQQLAQILSDGRTRIAIDLSAVTFIDSSGLGSLAATRKQLGNAGEIGLFPLWLSSDW